MSSQNMSGRCIYGRHGEYRHLLVDCSPGGDQVDDVIPTPLPRTHHTTGSPLDPKVSSKLPRGSSVSAGTIYCPPPHGSRCDSCAVIRPIQDIRHRPASRDSEIPRAVHLTQHLHRAPGPEPRTPNPRAPTFDLRPAPIGPRVHAHSKRGYEWKKGMFVFGSYIARATQAYGS